MVENLSIAAKCMGRPNDLWRETQCWSQEAMLWIKWLLKNIQFEMLMHYSRGTELPGHTNRTTPALQPDKPNPIIPQHKFGDRLFDLVDFKRTRISSRNYFTKHIPTTDINVEILSSELFKKMRCCYAYVYWYLMVMNQVRFIKGVVGLRCSKHKYILSC